MGRLQLLLPSIPALSTSSSTDLELLMTQVAPVPNSTMPSLLLAMEQAPSHTGSSRTHGEHLGDRVATLNWLVIRATCVVSPLILSLLKDLAGLHKLDCYYRQ